MGPYRTIFSIKILASPDGASMAGTLRTFNRTYRERRLAAKRDGKPFMAYSQALAKLRAVIADSVARGEIPKSFARVFDEARPSP
jgi:hypothetical protein